jgi:hypothetical protein
MKTNSKKMFAGFLGLVFVLSLVAPVASFAQTTPSRASFCSRIDQIIAPIEQRIADREGKLEARWQEVDANLTKREADRMARLSDYRNTRDDNREAQYAKLEAKATTDAQKQAVANFKATVEAAVVTRKAAVDSAIASLQQSVDQSIEARRAKITTATHEFKSAKSAAIAKAKVDCSAGVDPKTIRETFRASMKAAQDKFKSDYQVIEKLKGSFESVRVTKQQAVKTAIADFKTVVEKAKADLKAAFGQ